MTPDSIQAIEDYPLDKLNSTGCLFELVKLFPAALQDLEAAIPVEYTELEDLRSLAGQLAECNFGAQMFFPRSTLANDISGPFVVTVTSQDQSGNLQLRTAQFNDATVVGVLDPTISIQVPADEVVLQLELSPDRTDVVVSRVTERCQNT